MQNGHRILPCENTMVMSQDTERMAFLLALSRAPGVTPVTLRSFLSSFGSPSELLNATDEVGERLSERAKVSIQALRNAWERHWEAAKTQAEMHRNAGIEVLALTDEYYPPLLKRIKDAPALLFVKGSSSVIRELRTIAIVGTRTPTPLGSRIARQVARDFAREGFTVVSGLAKGIDAEAHEGTLAAHGRTIAVLANSLDHVYPKENKPLAARILENGGALISEYPLGSKTFRSAFVQRDRIQSGMSLGVIAVQTDVEGGTMHTVRFAEEQGRPIFCPNPLPEENGMKQYAGIKLLIQTGRAESFRKEDHKRVVNRLLSYAEDLKAVTATSSTGSLDEKKQAAAAPGGAQESVPDVDEGERILVMELAGLIKQRGISDKKTVDRILTGVKGEFAPPKQGKRRKKQGQEPQLFPEN